MALHSSMKPQAILNRIVRDQSSGTPLPLVDVLKSAQLVTVNALRFAQRERLKSEKGYAARLAEINEQLQILDCIEFGFITPVLDREEE